MQQGRLILAIALSVLILVIFQKINYREPVNEPAVESVDNTTIDDKMSTKSIDEDSGVYEQEKINKLSIKKETIKSEKLQLKIESINAGISEIKIKDKNDEFINLVDESNKKESLGLDTKDGIQWQLKKIGANKIIAKKIVDSIIYIRRIELKENNRISINNEIKNSGNNIKRAIIDQGWFNGLGTTEDLQKENFNDNRVFGKIDGIKKSKLETGTYSGDINWIGILNRYFICVLYDIPEQYSDLNIRTRAKGILAGCTQSEEARILPDVIMEKSIDLNPRETINFQQKLYIGLKDKKELKKIDEDIEKIIFTGLFAPLSMLALKVLLFFNGFTNNYGLAIILLTMVLQVILFPLTSKSYKSMNDMKKVQPSVTKLKEKFKDDPQRMNQEMMAIYKKHKVNPFGGCFPLLLQFPVFISLFTMLRGATELRYATFLWINDLSHADVLFASIPLIKNIPIIGSAGPLPFLMGAVMLLQQKVTGGGMEGPNKSLTYMMPIVFTFLFIKFPSGLVLYWLSNSVISFFIQLSISKKN